MPVTLTFGVLGEEQVARTLDRLADRAEDLTPAWEVLRQRFLRVELRQFASEGRYSGGWAPLSPRYAAWKARHYPGKTILRRTDELWRSLTVGPEIAILRPTEMTLGTAVPYAIHHQRPSTPGQPPRRRPLELSEYERRQWVKVLQAHIVTGHQTGVGDVR